MCVSGVSHASVVLGSGDDNAAGRIAASAIDLCDAEVVVEGFPTGFEFDGGNVLGAIETAIVSEVDGLVPGSEAAGPGDCAVIGMGRARRLLPLADLPEGCASIRAAIDVQSRNQNVIGVCRIDPHDIAVPALIAQVASAGVDSRVCLPAIVALVDITAVVVETRVDDGGIASRVRYGD